MSSHEAGSRFATVVQSRAFHATLLAVGAAFLLITAFHGNVWFDESYSVGIASHSFADIWRIGSSDVHPVLFYWALHVLYLVFGSNILVYRLFAVMGAVALAALGLTHVRKDFGARTGLLFTFFALFTPYVANMAVEIRMYSWATFFVAVCGIYALRVVRACRCGMERAGVPHVSAKTWALFAVASLASAYLHYFGALSAFVINALMLVYLIRHAKACRVELATFAALAAAQVALYAPWLVQLAGQIGVVSQSYWANLVFPDTYIELATYPVRTSQMAFAAKGWYGPVVQLGATLCLIAVLASLAIAAIALFVAAVRHARAHFNGSARRNWFARKNPGSSSDRSCDPASVQARKAEGQGAAECRAAAEEACVNGGSAAWRAFVAALVVYLGVFAIAWAASVAMDSLIVYYRYMFVAIGPLIFALSVALAHVRCRWVPALVCVSFMAAAVLNQGLAVYDYYAEDNAAPLAYFQEAVAWANEDALAEVNACTDGSAEAAGESELVESANDGGRASVVDESHFVVLSSDIGVEGVTAVAFPGISQTYLDWQPGNWGAAYEAYAPTLTSVKSWGQALDGKSRRFVVLGQSSDGSTPRDVQDIDDMDGISCIDAQVFYRPYERTYFTVACMEKD